MTDNEVLASLRPPGYKEQTPDQPDPFGTPMTPEQYAAAAAPGTPDVSAPSSPVAPNPAAAFEAPTEGPPAPSPTDAIAATMPPPVPGGPTEDPQRQFAPDVPREAPGVVPPGGAQAALAASKPAGSEGGIESALKDVEAARTDSDAAKEEQFRQQQTDKASEHQAAIDFATKRREELEARQKQDEANAALNKAADEKAQAGLAASDAAIKNFKFKDLWADKTGAQNAGSALGMALLAIGAGMMKTPKYAIEILDKQMADDHQKQLDNLHLLQDDYIRAHTGIADAATARKKMESDIQLGRARKDELIAAQFDEAAQKAKDPSMAADAAAFSTKLKQDSAEAKLSALTTLQQLHLKEDAAELERKLKEAQINNLNARAGLANRGLGQGHKAGGGGGGGAGGGHLGDAAEEMARLIREGKDENGAHRELTQDEKIHEANRLHIPLTVKPSQVTLTSINAGSVFNKNEDRKDTRTDAAGKRAGLQQQKFDETAVKNFTTEHQLPKLEAAHRKLEEVKRALDSGNPTAAMSALMEYDAAAKGSAATESSMHAIQDRLGGSWDQFKGWFERKESGNFGPEQLKNLKGAVDVGLKGFKESVEPIHRAYYERFDGSQPGVKDRASSLFGPFGYREKGGAGGGDSDLVRKARAAVSDQSRAPAVRAAAQKILDQAGASNG